MNKKHDTKPVKPNATKDLVAVTFAQKKGYGSLQCDTFLIYILLNFNILRH